MHTEDIASKCFEKATNSFQARLVWTEEVPIFRALKPSYHDYVRQEEEINVEEEWVKSQFEPMYEEIVNMRQDKANWTQVPQDVEVFIGKKKIVRLRYVPESKRNLVDLEELNKLTEQELEERKLERWKEATKQGKHKRKPMESPKPKVLTAQTSEQSLLRSTPHKHFLKGLDALMKRKSWLPR